MTRKRLSTKQRKELYRAEVAKARATGLGDFPICAICHFPILPGRKWHESHQAHKPAWLGGALDGIAHQKCNELHNNRQDTPKWAKSERIRKRYLDKTMRGEVVDRRTGARWGGWK